MTSQSSTGIAAHFSAATTAIIAAATAGKSGSKVAAWEEDRATFFKAVTNDDTGTAAHIIAEYPGEWTKWKNDKGISGLQVAQERGNLAALTLLLDHGAEINERYKNGWYPIHMAYKGRQTEIFNALLERGADLDKEVVTKRAGEFTSACTTTLLHMAVEADDKNTLVSLLEHGAKASITTRHLNFYIPLIHTSASYLSAGELATKKGRHLLGDLITRANVLRADFLAAAKPAPPPAPAPADDGKIDVMNPLQIKKPGTP